MSVTIFMHVNDKVEVQRLTASSKGIDFLQLTSSDGTQAMNVFIAWSHVNQIRQLLNENQPDLPVGVDDVHAND